MLGLFHFQSLSLSLSFCMYIPIWAPLCGANDMGRHQFDVINNLLALPGWTNIPHLHHHSHLFSVVVDHSIYWGENSLWPTQQWGKKEFFEFGILKFEIIFTLGITFTLDKIWSGHVSVTYSKCLVSLFLFELYLEKKWTKLSSNFFQYLIFQKFLLTMNSVV